MKNITMILLMTLAFASSSAMAEDSVLCSQTLTAPVYNDDLKSTLFMARQFETVVEFQGFGQKEMYRPFYMMESSVEVVNRMTDLRTLLSSMTASKILYVRVEFVDRDEEDADNNVGWINKAFIVPRSKCPSYRSPVIIGQSNTPSKLNLPKTIPMVALGVNGSINANCCSFPLKVKPTMNYTEDMRRFGANRSGGSRVHAAADLYQSQYQPIYAIADGTVLRDRVPFYLGTSVTEIEHPGGFIARYGEIASGNLKILKLGKTVKAGQLIGYIKKVNTRSVKSAMLHFELYTGKGKGPLTTGRGKYQRRTDLVNPTGYLMQWEKSL